MNFEDQKEMLTHCRRAAEQNQPQGTLVFYAAVSVQSPLYDADNALAALKEWNASGRPHCVRQSTLEDLSDRKLVEVVYPYSPPVWFGAGRPPVFKRALGWHPRRACYQIVQCRLTTKGLQTVAGESEAVA